MKWVLMITNLNLKGSYTNPAFSIVHYNVKPNPYKYYNAHIQMFQNKTHTYIIIYKKEKEKICVNK